MKKIIAVILTLTCLLILYGCKQNKTSTALSETDPIQTETQSQRNTEDEAMLKIEVNGHTLYADFEDNSSAQALKEKLEGGSITLTMSDYGGFEKVSNLPFELPRNDKRITTKPGDVILYQGDKLTIYYGKNTWEFTRVAVIRDAGQLKDLLGDGDASITFSLE